MTPAQRRYMWAVITAHWGKDTGEYIVYAVMIARYGKASTKALTFSEVEDLLAWIEFSTGEKHESE